MLIQNEVAANVYKMYTADIKATKGKVNSRITCIDRLVMDACAITNFASTIQASSNYEARIKVISGYMQTDDVIYTSLASLFHKSMSKSRRELLILLNSIQNGVKARTRFDEVEHEMNVVAYREIIRELRDSIMNNDELEHFHELYKVSKPLRVNGGKFKDINDKNFGMDPIAPNAPFEPIKQQSDDPMDELRDVIACIMIDSMGYDYEQLTPDNIPGFDFDALETITIASFANNITDLAELRSMCEKVCKGTTPQPKRRRQPEREGVNDFASRMRKSNVDLSGTIFADEPEFPRYAETFLRHTEIPPEDGDEWDGDDYDYSGEGIPQPIEPFAGSKPGRVFDPTAAERRREQDEIADIARGVDDFYEVEHEMDATVYRELLKPCPPIITSNPLLNQDEVDDLVDELEGELSKNPESVVNDTFAIPVVEEEVSIENVDTYSDSSGDVFVPISQDYIDSLAAEAEIENKFFEEARALNAAEIKLADEIIGGYVVTDEIVEEVEEEIVVESTEEVIETEDVVETVEDNESEKTTTFDNFNDIIIPIAYDEFDFGSITDESEREAIIQLASSAYMACRKSAIATASKQLHSKREELEQIGFESASLNGYLSGLYGDSNHVEYLVKNIARYDYRDNIVISDCALDNAMLLQRHTTTENELIIDYNYIFYSVLEFSIAGLDRFSGNDSTDHLIASAMHLASYYHKVHFANMYKTPFKCEYHMDLQHRCLHFIADHTLSKRNIAVLHTIWAKVCDTLTVNCKFKYYDGKAKAARRQFESTRNDCENFEFIIPPDSKYDEYDDE